VVVTVTSTLTTTAPPLSGSLNVFAAASLVEAFTDLGQRFDNANPGTKITFSFAGSQQLAQQIQQAAPTDIFASANMAQMVIAIKSGRIVSGTEQVLVRNRLVVVYPTDNPAHIASLQDLAKPGVRLILAAKEVPVGQYGLDFLDKAGHDPAFGPDYKANVLKNVVSYEQNVRAVLSKVDLGEADAGIVYSTDASSDKSGKTARLDIPDALNSIAVYPIAALNDSPQPELAKAFVDYTLSPAGQDVLSSYGFIKPGP
jgi:molybdate transport system substrate-binding protein